MLHQRVGIKCIRPDSDAVAEGLGRHIWFPSPFSHFTEEPEKSNDKWHEWGRFTNIKSADLVARWRIRSGSPIRRPTVAPRQNIMKFKRKSLFLIGIFPRYPAPPSPGLYCHTNISLVSSGTHVQRSLQCLSFCFINWLSPLFSTRKGRARNRFRAPFSNNLPQLRVSEPTPLNEFTH
jgi:hypothetical protein